MKKILVFIFLIIFSEIGNANDSGYVSPETYAINEADMTDYFNIPAPQKLNVDDLDNHIKLNKTAPSTQKSSETAHKTKHSKKEKKPYEERMIYKAAKWWTDQTYKFDDPHHGEKHEIKIKAREEYEKQQAEELSRKNQEQM